jgi:hypothetical protein
VGNEEVHQLFSYINNYESPSNVKCLVDWESERSFELGLELELIQTRAIQKPLLWVEAVRSACADCA